MVSSGVVTLGAVIEETTDVLGGVVGPKVDALVLMLVLS
jgi:hypothetical protein